MAEIPTMVVTMNAAGIDTIAGIIAHLRSRNQELERALTEVQVESTRQVEVIRELELGHLLQRVIQIQMIDRYREFRACSIEVHKGEVYVLDVEGNCLMAEPVDRIVFARAVESQPEGERMVAREEKR